MKKYKMSEYITPEDFINYPHGVELDTSVMTDKKISQLIDLAGQYVQDYIDLPFLKEQVIEVRSGSGSSKIVISYANQTTNMISIKEINNSGYMTEIVKSDYGFSRDLSCVALYKQIFYPYFNYEIKYTTGELELPDNVKNAIILTGAYILQTQEIGGMNSIQIDIIKIAFNKTKGTLPDSAIDLLSKYKIEARCI